LKKASSSSTVQSAKTVSQSRPRGLSPRSNTYWAAPDSTLQAADAPKLLRRPGRLTRPMTTACSRGVRAELPAVQR